MTPEENSWERCVRRAARRATALLDACNTCRLTICVDTDPQALVGKRLKVYWPGDKRDYKGTCEAFNPYTWRHTVRYDDGDVQKELLVVQKVHVLRLAGAQPTPPPTLQLLQRLGAFLSKKAEQEGRRTTAEAAAEAKQLHKAARKVMDRARERQEQQQHMRGALRPVQQPEAGAATIAAPAAGPSGRQDGTLGAAAAAELPGSKRKRGGGAEGSPERCDSPRQQRQPRLPPRGAVEQQQPAQPEQYQRQGQQEQQPQPGYGWPAALAVAYNSAVVGSAGGPSTRRGLLTRPDTVSRDGRGKRGREHGCEQQQQQHEQPPLPQQPQQQQCQQLRKVEPSGSGAAARLNPEQPILQPLGLPSPQRPVSVSEAPATRRTGTQGLGSELRVYAAGPSSPDTSLPPCLPVSSEGHKAEQGAPSLPAGVSVCAKDASRRAGPQGHGQQGVKSRVEEQQQQQPGQQHQQPAEPAPGLPASQIKTFERRASRQQQQQQQQPVAPAPSSLACQVKTFKRRALAKSHLAGSCLVAPEPLPVLAAPVVADVPPAALAAAERPGAPDAVPSAAAEAGVCLTAAAAAAAATASLTAETSTVEAAAGPSGAVIGASGRAVAGRTTAGAGSMAAAGPSGAAVAAAAVASSAAGAGPSSSTAAVRGAAVSGPSNAAGGASSNAVAGPSSTAAGASNAAVLGPGGAAAAASSMAPGASRAAAAGLSSALANGASAAAAGPSLGSVSVAPAAPPHGALRPSPCTQSQEPACSTSGADAAAAVANGAMRASGLRSPSGARWLGRTPLAAAEPSRPATAAPAPGLAPKPPLPPAAASTGGLPPAAPKALNSGKPKASAAATSGKMQYIDCDVALHVDPEALVGLPIKVLWPSDREYYPGRAVTYDPQTCKHRVSYDDGTFEDLVLALEKVRLGLRSGEHLSDKRRPTPAMLRALSAAVAREADQMQLAPGVSSRQVGTVRSRAAALAAAADASEASAAEQAAKAAVPKGTARRWGSLGPGGASGPPRGQGQAHRGRGWNKKRGAGLWGAAAGGAQAQPALEAAEAQEMQAQLQSAWSHFERHKASFPQFREVDAACCLPPEAFVGRQLRVHWPADEAWFLGNVTHYCQETGQHRVDYVDGESEVLHLAAEEVRLLVHAGERLEGAGAAGMRDMAGKMETAAQGLLEAVGRGEGEAEECEEKAGRLIEKARQMRARAEAWGAGREEEEELGQEEEEAGQEEQAGDGREAEQGPKVDEEMAAGQEGGAGKGADATGAKQADAAGTAAAAPLPEAPNGAGAANAGPAHAAVAAEPGHAAAGGEPRHAAVVAAAPASLAPGDPAWACVRGLTPWPCTVVTREEALRRGASRACGACGPGRVFVTFFGDHASAGVSAAAVAQFPEGLRAELHNPRVAGGARGTARWRAALSEALAYLREGELPRGMVPWHGDDVFAADSSEEDEAEEEEAGVGAAAARALQLPLQVSKSLTLLRLGRVEWLNPLFHTERFVYPVGFAVSRLAATPASGKREVPHVMEIDTTADGLHPVFRVTPEGCAPVEGATPAQAFGMLWDCDPASKGKSVQRSGPEAFGLMHDTIVRLIHGLPGVARCDKYCRRLGRRAAPELSNAERIAREAVLASLQALPPGVEPQPDRCGSSACWECEVCGEETEFEGSYLLHCDMCQLCVHMDCVGVDAPPDGSLWLCDLCTLRSSGRLKGGAPPCVLCPVVGGPMKRTTDGRWCHLVCAMWTPEVGFADPDRREPIECVDKVTLARRRLLCSICRQPYGAPIQCAGGRKCCTAFHPLCARNAGLHMYMEAAGEEEPNGAEGDAMELAGCGGEARDVAGDGGDASAVDRAGSVGGGDSDAENRLMLSGSGTDTVGVLPFALPRVPGGEVLREVHVPEGQVAVPMEADCEPAARPKVPVAVAEAGAGGQTAVVRGKGRKAQAVPTAWEEGTLAGSQRLLCFCNKHRALAAAEPGRKRVYRALQEQHQQRQQQQQQVVCAGGVAAALSLPQRAGPGGSSSRAVAVLGAGPSAGPLQPQTSALPVAAAAAAAAARSWPGGQVPEAIAHAHGSARCIPLASRQSRGLREPETIARFEAKRLYVKRTPYLVTGCLRQPPLPLPPLAFRTPSAEQAAPAPAPSEAGDAAAVAVEEPGQVPTGAVPSITAAAPAPERPADEGSGAGAPEGPFVRGTEGAAVTDGAAAVGPPPLSMAERYRLMQATLRLRVTCGKSAIHGLGAIAKAPHRAGDMVIEYVGELIRPSVADVRERASYNQLVGCGTYVFKLNEASCLDATRAGNMAHLLNHSCQPNCISRTISVRQKDGGDVQDHVIIFAKRDVSAGEELTYDYRFNGEEKLPCNCGAAGCRGFVNLPEEETTVVVSRAELAAATRQT